ncbi:MAG: hydantoinase/oxoprolinase family protein [Firmicutes bacterium]|nr:hydantoinase/oxoprolinase family protein [Bacillota bacterium]
MYILGIDVGGTNTDAALIKDGAVQAVAKVPTKHHHLIDSTLAALDSVLQEQDKDIPFQLHLSTTLSTNAIIEEQGDPVFVLGIPGPGMRIEELNLGFDVEVLTGSIDHRGREVARLNSREVRQKLAEGLVSKDVGLAVVGKFSHRNPSHELEVKKIAREMVNTETDGFRHISLGHRLSGLPNFPRRLATSFLNASVARRQAGFADMVEELFTKGRNVKRIYLLKADGGTMTLKDSRVRPVETILSGPAASIMGAGSLMTHKDVNTVIVDIGGTTTDIAVQVGGLPVFQRQGAEIGRHKTLVPALFARSIGLGGDSEVHVAHESKNHIGSNNSPKFVLGPRRVGVPVALGGEKITPTDAAVALGLAALGDQKRAQRAIAEFGHEIGLDAKTAAKSIIGAFVNQLKTAVCEVYQYLETRPVYTVTELLAPKDIRPRLIVGLGGPAEVFIPMLAKAMDISWEILPHYQEANAVGAAASRPTAAVTLHADTALGTVTVPEMDYAGEITDSRGFNIDQARLQATKWAAKRGKQFDITDLEDIAIIEEESFNMVRGFHRTGRIFMIRAQVRPGVRRVSASKGWADEHLQSKPTLRRGQSQDQKQEEFHG